MTEIDEKRGRLIPVAIIAFFVVVAIVNVIFLYFAFETHPGLETEDAYDTGLNYNDEIERQKEYAALGWQGAIEHTPEGRVVVSIRDKDGNPVSGLTVTAIAVWPVKEGFDTGVSFEEEGDVYAAEPKLPKEGQWEFRITATDDQGHTYRFAERVMM